MAGAISGNRVFLVAGEVSGDQYAASLVREMRRLSPDELAFEGIGGRRLREAGVPLLADSSTWGAIGVTQVLRLIPRLAWNYFRARRHLAKGEPGLFVPIDFGFANIRLARRAKELGWRVLYFVPPGSWRRDRQGRDLPKVTDAIVTPFPWSAEMLTKMGANAHFFGHPLRQIVREQGSGAAVTRDGLAVLPGSRISEIELNLPLIAETVKRLGRVPRIEFAVANSVDPVGLSHTWRRLVPDIPATFTVGDAYGVLQRAEAGIICSGTATLEGVLCDCPMVVIYRLSPLTRLETRILRVPRPKFVSLPNILLEREAVPERILEDAVPELIAPPLAELLTDPDARERQREAFRKLDGALGPDDAITRTAALALGLRSV